MPEFITTLKQFLEQASLGDFHVRLHMLLAFHCNLVAMETRCAAVDTGDGVPVNTQDSGISLTSRQDVAMETDDKNDNGNISDGQKQTSELVARLDAGGRSRLREMTRVLWNMHQFYARFSHTVTTELKRLRDPIEKELKVKLVTLY